MKRIPVASEGWLYISISFGCACLAVFHLGYGSIVFWLIFIGILNFFRDPDRHSGLPESAIVAPADGKIIFIGDSDLGEAWANYRKISIFMNIFNVHVNRAPVSGTIRSVEHFPGKYVSAYKDAASRENERVEVVVDSGTGPILVRLVAGLIARRIVCKLQPGDQVKREERIGMIKFGSRVDIYLPSHVKITIGMGDKTVAGVTKIGMIPESD